MAHEEERVSKRFRNHVSLALLGAMLGALGILVMTCGGNGSQTDGLNTQNNASTTGAVTTSLTDPPTCMAPNGQFSHVWVTITQAQANLSADAGPSDSGWVNLVNLTTAPKQIDLLSLSSTTCLLTQLGSTTGLPPGNYQQIRLLLLANEASGAVPSPNQCGSAGFNCVVLGNGTTATLNLSSEAQTGIKIPSGQISRGSINLTAGQSADIDIDFNTCESILEEGNGRFRLKPVLHAGEVSLNQNSITGQVVDSVTRTSIASASVWVEQPDSTGTDQVIREALTASDGTFIFCPLASGDYDVVVDAAASLGAGLTKTYNATVTFKVPVGTAMGAIPLVAETGVRMNILPATIKGQVTTSAIGNNATAADITVSALQQAEPTGGPATMVSIPILVGSTPTVATATSSTCPTNTGCVNYVLLVPASNPSVGTFSAAGTTYAAAASGNVAYSIDAQAFLPDGSNSPDCSPSELMTSVELGGGPLVVAAGATVTAKALAFTGCQ